MAAQPEPESTAAMLRQFLGGDADNLRLFPILVARVSPPAAAAGDVAASPPPDRVLLINPRTQSVMVLQGEAAEMMLAGGGNPGVPPASKAAIKGLRTVEAGEIEKDMECAVCLDELVGEGEGEGEVEVEVEVKEMPCKHLFHEMCIEKWLGLHGSCPVCRFEMPAEEKAEMTDVSGGEEVQRAEDTSSGNGDGEEQGVEERSGGDADGEGQRVEVSSGGDGEGETGERMGVSAAEVLMAMMLAALDSTDDESQEGDS